MHYLEERDDLKESSRRIIGQVQEQAHIVHRTVLLKVWLEETCSLHVDLGIQTNKTNMWNAE